MSIFRRHISGVHLDHAKASRMVETADIALPEYVTIPLRQHIGAGCEATVKAGDTVLFKASRRMKLEEIIALSGLTEQEA